MSITTKIQDFLYVNNDKFLSRYAIKQYIQSESYNALSEYQIKLINKTLNKMVADNRIIKKNDSYKLKKLILHKNSKIYYMNQYVKHKQYIFELENTISNLKKIINNYKKNYNTTIKSNDEVIVKSMTDKTKSYTVNTKNMTCTCPHFIYRKKKCKHINSIT